MFWSHYLGSSRSNSMNGKGDVSKMFHCDIFFLLHLYLTFFCKHIIRIRTFLALHALACLSAHNLETALKFAIGFFSVISGWVVIELLHSNKFGVVANISKFKILNLEQPRHQVPSWTSSSSTTTPTSVLASLTTRLCLCTYYIKNRGWILHPATATASLISFLSIPVLGWGPSTSTNN